MRPTDVNVIREKLDLFRLLLAFELNPALQLGACEAAKVKRLLTDDDLEKLDDPQVNATIKRNQECGDNLSLNEVAIHQLQQAAE